MVKPIHARQGNSLAIGRHAAPGRVPCKKSEMFDYPSGFLPRQKATSPDKGRHGCAANPGERGTAFGKLPIFSTGRKSLLHFFCFLIKWYY